MISPLDEVRQTLGAPKRKLGWFSKPPIEFPRPPWAAENKEDQLLAVFDHFRSLYKEGVVVWGWRVMANATLFRPGDEDSVGEMLYSLRDPDEVALSLLPQFVHRLHELSETEPDASWTERERELAEDIQSGFTYHGGFRLPEHWVPHERDYRLSSMVFHRGHLPGGYLQGPLLPLLVMPWAPFPAIVVPEKYWTPAVREIMAGIHPKITAGPARELREKQYTETLGPIVSVFHEMEPRGQHIDVYLFGPRDPQNHYLYLTGGMSDARQPSVNGAEGARIELALYATQPHELLIDLVRNFAHYPFETGQALGHGHTVPLGYHAERCLGSPRFPILLFVAALSADDRALGGKVVIEGDPVYPLMVIPITAAEFEFVQTQGLDEFLARVAASKESIKFNPERPSIV